MPQFTIADLERQGYVMTDHGLMKKPRAKSGGLETCDAIRGDLPAGVGPARPTLLALVLRGQVRGGKNAMGVTRSGRHYARPQFKKWRAEMATQILAQLPPGFECIARPVNLRVDYFAGDRKRRDQSGILDALFHLLEHCGIVRDDALLWVSESSRGYDKEHPRTTITFLAA